ncbi:MAG: sensor histidine kinase [Actinomycetota bacterium]|nr:sensor histidine kinase [Actinomycetota bacterium]
MYPTERAARSSVIERVRRWFVAEPLAADGALAAVVFSTVVIALAVDPPPTWGAAELVGMVLLVACHAAIALRRVHPVLSLWIAVPANLTMLAMDVLVPTIFPMIIGFYSVAANVERDRSARIIAPAFALISLVFLSGILDDEVEVSLSDVLSALLIFATAWILGTSLRTRRRLFESLEQRAREAEARRVEDSRRAVIDERHRIARELHDIVAHSMSVMVVQATAARRVLHKSPDQADEAIGSIEATGREALGEMRRLLGVLRTDGNGEANGAGGPGERAPQPGLVRLPQLLQQCREAGLTITQATTGTERALPAGVDLTAYRVLQEALTNAIKHAGPAHVDVALRYEDDRLVIEVNDDGHGAAAFDPDADPGHGMIGMRERVELFGGHLGAGPRAGGGYAVRAELPIASSGLT